MTYRGIPAVPPTPASQNIFLSAIKENSEKLQAAATATDSALSAVTATANATATLADTLAAQTSSIYLDADYTLTSSTSVQKLFNTSTNGALTLDTGVYLFELQVYLLSMSATSGNAGFSLAGTATTTGQLMHVVGIDATAPTTVAAQTGAWAIGATGFTTDMLTAGTGTGAAATIRGVFKLTAAGTIIPSIKLTTAAATAVKAGTWMRIQRMADVGTYTVGNWS